MLSAPKEKRCGIQNTIHLGKHWIFPSAKETKSQQFDPSHYWNACLALHPTSVKPIPVLRFVSQHEPWSKTFCLLPQPVNWHWIRIKTVRKSKSSAWKNITEHKRATNFTAAGNARFNYWREIMQRSWLPSMIYNKCKGKVMWNSQLINRNSQ